MVRNYKRKSNRGAWTDGQIQLAVEQVKNGKSIKSCAADTNKSVWSRKRNRGTATIVTSDSYIEKLVEAEKAKRIKIEPKENSEKVKQKPKILSVETVKKPTPNILKKRTPIEPAKRQPLGHFNYQSVQGSNEKNSPIHTIHTANSDDIYVDAAVINGALMVQNNYGHYEPVYLNKM